MLAKQNQDITTRLRKVRLAMIKKLIELSAINKGLTLFLVLVVTAIGWYSMKKIPLDAIPDLSDTQVIVYSTWNVSPDIMEDQVTYPVVTSLLGVPKVKDIRGLSTFGASYVYVIFEDGTDIYWARSRVLEYLSKITPKLPEGVNTELGPDATGVGWVYQYALKDTSGKRSLADLRSFQDWFCAISYNQFLEWRKLPLLVGFRSNIRCR